MAEFRGASEESRERKIVLFHTLVEAYRAHTPLTQEEILDSLTIDDYSRGTRNPGKKLAYDGNQTARRQKFERDKSDIRDLGIRITMTRNDDGVEVYSINADDYLAPAIDFTEEENDVVVSALSLLGIGSDGVTRLFGSTSASSSALTFPSALLPLAVAEAQRQTVRFDYRSKKLKSREVTPLRLISDQGQLYVVGYDVEEKSIRGFRVSRIESIPEVTVRRAVVPDEFLEAAEKWSPLFEESVEPVEVIFTISSRHRGAIETRLAGAQFVTLGVDGERLEVRTFFDGRTAALRMMISIAEFAHQVQPKWLATEMKTWFRGVNKKSKLDATSFTFPEISNRPNAFAQALQIVATVYAADGPILASELAERFSMDIELVKHLMNKFISMQSHRHNGGYLVAIIPADDFDEEDLYDPSYQRSNIVTNAKGGELSAMTRKDVIELLVALKQAAGLQPSSVLDGIILKIEKVTQSHIDVHLDIPAFVPAIQAAIGYEIPITYFGANDDRESTRTIIPGSIGIRNHHYYVRAFYVEVAEWRTWRIDRIVSVGEKGEPFVVATPDPLLDWITMPFEGGAEVVLAINDSQRWLFESLPHTVWALNDTPQRVVRVRVADDSFLDHLMCQAGPGASVLSESHTKAGRVLAKRIVESI